ELLEARERTVFEMLSVFATSRLQALESVAASVLEGGLDLDALASLIDKSLVRSVDADGTQRFAMLKTIQEYAAERLAQSPERERAVQHAHAVHVSAHAHELAGELRGDSREAALGQLDGVIGNLRTAW